MSALDLHSVLKDLADRKKRPLDFVSVYEDFYSGLGTVRTLEHLLISNSLPFQPKPRCAWEFSLLASQQHLAEAARIAARADLILISKSRSKSIPKTVTRWFDEWTGLRSDREGVLLAFTDEESPTSEEIKYFQDRAQGAGLAFFVHGIEPTRSLQGNTGSPERHSEWEAFKTVSQFVRHPASVQRWGINEY